MLKVSHQSAARVALTGGVHFCCALVLGARQGTLCVEQVSARQSTCPRQCTPAPAEGHAEGHAGAPGAQSASPRPGRPACARAAGLSPLIFILQAPRTRVITALWALAGLWALASGLWLGVWGGRGLGAPRSWSTQPFFTHAASKKLRLRQATALLYVQ